MTLLPSKFTNPPPISSVLFPIICACPHLVLPVASADASNTTHSDLLEKSVCKWPRVPWRAERHLLAELLKLRCSYTGPGDLVKMQILIREA